MVLAMANIIIIMRIALVAAASAVLTLFNFFVLSNYSISASES